MVKYDAVAPSLRLTWAVSLVLCGLTVNFHPASDANVIISRQLLVWSLGESPGFEKAVRSGRYALFALIAASYPDVALPWGQPEPEALKLRRRALASAGAAETRESLAEGAGAAVARVMPRNRARLRVEKRPIVSAEVDRSILY